MLCLLFLFLTHTKLGSEYSDEILYAATYKGALSSNQMLKFVRAYVFVLLLFSFIIIIIIIMQREKEKTGKGWVQ